MGVFEMSKFENGTKAVLDALVLYTKQNGLISVIGILINIILIIFRWW